MWGLAGLTLSQGGLRSRFPFLAIQVIVQYTPCIVKLYGYLGQLQSPYIDLLMLTWLSNDLFMKSIHDVHIIIMQGMVNEHADD